MIKAMNVENLAEKHRMFISLKFADYFFYYKI